ncbi:MAG: prepilin-type N-terminal cleavage/methylation domain-containing protein [Pirellulales bacterium]|nr:prepilin-type N-terminal cleavage/methylation domain-containing protein [Pirellulales bacterium]
MRQSFLASLGEILRRLLAWWRPIPVPVPVRKPQTPNGLTIVEMLVTMAISLIMMAAVVNVFARVSDSVNKRRAAIEMSGMLRSGRQLLQNDLAGATCPTLPWMQPEAGAGYFEMIEGPLNDSLPSYLTDGDPGTGNGELDGNTSLVPRGAIDKDTLIPTAFPNGLGDYDDILALTVRSDGEPFVGRFGNGTIESNLAEIIWFAVENPLDGSLGEPGLRTVYRRVLLIAPWVNLPTNSSLLHPSIPATHPDRLFRMFYQRYDISARLEGDQWIPNTLADLTKRENRFAHQYDPSNPNVGFPHAMDLSVIRLFNPTLNASPLHPFGYPFERFYTNNDSEYRPLPENTENRAGEDIVLTDVLAFDIRVYDPKSPIRNAGTPSVPIAVKPGDPAWGTVANTVSYLGQGAYVDLGYNVAFGGRSERWDQATFDPLSIFSMQIHPKSGLLNYPLPFIHAVYDTWSYHYETDGLDQDNRDGDNNVFTGVDEGTDGIDNDNQFGVDDMGERETSPPYAVPLRGVQVTLRVFERDSRLPRQVSVRQSFVPE